MLLKPRLHLRMTVGAASQIFRWCCRAESPAELHGEIGYSALRTFPEGTSAEFTVRSAGRE